MKKKVILFYQINIIKTLDILLIIKMMPVQMNLIKKTLIKIIQKVKDIIIIQGEIEIMVILQILIITTKIIKMIILRKKKLLVLPL